MVSLRRTSLTLRQARSICELWKIHRARIAHVDELAVDDAPPETKASGPLSPQTAGRFLFSADDLVRSRLLARDFAEEFGGLSSRALHRHVGLRDDSRTRSRIVHHEHASDLM